MSISPQRQSRTSLLRRAVRTVELRRDLQVRSRKPDPLGADVVHVGEDRRDGAGSTGRFGSPGGRVKMLDEKLVHAIIGGKDPDGGPGELSVIFFGTSTCPNGGQRHSSP